MPVSTTVDQTVDQTPAYCLLRNGVYYFTRRIPEDLKHHYKTSRIVLTLRTKVLGVARKRARKMAEELERFWEKLRWNSGDVPGKQYLRAGEYL